jgi:hypothetical protein
LLPSGASAIALLSPEGAIDFVQRILPAFMPPQAKLELKLPAFGKTVPVGFAVMAGKDELRTCTVVPGEVMQAVGQYVGKLRAAHGGAAK